MTLKDLEFLVSAMRKTGAADSTPVNFWLPSDVEAVVKKPGDERPTFIDLVVDFGESLSEHRNIHGSGYSLPLKLDTLDGSKGKIAAEAHIHQLLEKDAAYRYSVSAGDLLNMRKVLRAYEYPYTEEDAQRQLDYAKAQYGNWGALSIDRGALFN